MYCHLRRLRLPRLFLAKGPGCYAHTVHVKVCDLASRLAVPHLALRCQSSTFPAGLSHFPFPTFPHEGDGWVLPLYRASDAGRYKGRICRCEVTLARWPLGEPCCLSALLCGDVNNLGSRSHLHQTFLITAGRQACLAPCDGRVADVVSDDEFLAYV